MSGIDKVDTGSPLLPPIAVIGTPSSPPHVITPSHQNVISNKSGLNHHPNGHSSHTGPSGTSDVILSNGTTHMSAMTCDHLLSPEVNANDLAVVTRCPAEPSVMASFPDDPQYLNMPDVHLGKDYSCGLCSLRPKWLQRLANKQSFLTIFCLTSVLQGMVSRNQMMTAGCIDVWNLWREQYYTYFVSVLTTIEKLYQIQSKTTGIIMSATEIGQIGGALLLTYYGGQGHRPKWISCGMLIFALASIFCSTPHYLFGGPASLSSSSSSPLSSLSSPPPISSFTSGDPFETGDEESEESSHPHFQIRRFSEKLCHSYNRSRIENLDHRPSESFDTLTSDHKEGRLFSSYDDVSSSSHKSVSRCDDPELSSSQSRVKYTVLTIFFMSLFLIGIGATAVNTLGIPYIDDNVAPRESPLYFGMVIIINFTIINFVPISPQYTSGITIGVRIFGPVFGFLLGSICTSIYVGFPFGNYYLTQLLLIDIIPSDDKHIISSRVWISHLTLIRHLLFDYQNVRGKDKVISQQKDVLMIHKTWNISIFCLDPNVRVICLRVWQPFPFYKACPKDSWAKICLHAMLDMSRFWQQCIYSCLMHTD